MANPFDGEIFTFTQPDGTQFEVRGWGNQYSAVFETLDGYTVGKDLAFRDNARDAIETSAGTQN